MTERSLLDIAGVLDDDEAESVREAVEEHRARRARELERIAESLES